VCGKTIYEELPLSDYTQKNDSTTQCKSGKLPTQFAGQKR